MEQLRRGLLNAADSGGSVVVVEGEGVREAVMAVEAQRRSKEVSGFRIVIFSDNGQYAGDNAESVLKEFKALYPRINAYMVYESPYFKVSVGDCLSMEEAQILMAKIVANYPKAFPRRESIALEALTSPLTAVVEPVDTLSLPIIIGE
ncbi:MAG: SPOR domain-containing protein [Alistipes sp.]|nr:SPOR domain-containing protein [Alistipes sp.]